MIIIIWIACALLFSRQKIALSSVWAGYATAQPSSPVDPAVQYSTVRCEPSTGWAPWDRVLNDDDAPLFRWFDNAE